MFLKILVIFIFCSNYFSSIPGEGTPCQIKNHVQRKFATPILYAIDIFNFFSSTYIIIDNIFYIFFLKILVIIFSSNCLSSILRHSS
jgi:hypothetical protein